MRNLQSNSLPDLPMALGLTSTKKAAQSVSPFYYVDECKINNGMIDVDFTIDDNWSSAVINSFDLRRFVLTEGLNDYCFDSCANGEHVQDSGSFDPDTFVAENLYELIAAYLKAKKVWQVVD